MAGGGAEAHARNNQYQVVRSNSSLVLSPASGSRDPHVYKVESLRGKIDPKSFGDRAAHRGSPSTKKKKKKKQRDPNPEPAPIKRRRCLEESILTATEEDNGVYKPRSRETRSAYETMLDIIARRLGDHPVSVVHGAADEVLAVLKVRSNREADHRLRR